jgi:hypothetical protein
MKSDLNLTRFKFWWNLKLLYFESSHKHYFNTYIIKRYTEKCICKVNGEWVIQLNKWLYNDKKAKNLKKRGYKI